MGQVLQEDDVVGHECDIDDGWISNEGDDGGDTPIQPNIEGRHSV